MWVPTFVGDSALIIGNGESRSWYQPCHQTITKDGVDTWGCNAIYRDGKIDNLVATDPAMQQEIYKSDYATHNTCWFLEWNKVPTEIGDTFLMGFEVPEDWPGYIWHFNAIPNDPQKHHTNILMQTKANYLWR